MDNATYHNVLAEHSAPTSNSSKESIRVWLQNNKIPCGVDALKAELIMEERLQSLRLDDTT